MNTNLRISVIREDIRLDHIYWGNKEYYMKRNRFVIVRLKLNPLLECFQAIDPKPRKIQLAGVDLA